MSALYHKIIVGPHESVLLVRNGHDAGRLAPGVHRYFFGEVAVHRFDLRETLQRVPAQEVLTKDRVPVRFSLVIAHKVVDAERAFATVDSVADFVHSEAQLALREIVATVDLEQILEARSDLNDGLSERLASPLDRVGLELCAAKVQDFMVGGELKRAFGDVAKARAEAMAKLERTRGEAAALRSLANAARLFEEHKGLDRLKTLEIAGRAADNYQNTLVLGLEDPRRQLER